MSAPAVRSTDRDGDGLAIVSVSHCPICRNPRLRALPAPFRWIGKPLFAEVEAHLALSWCSTCRLAFVNPRPNHELLSNFYDCDSYICHAHDSTQSKLRKSDFILSMLEKASRFRRGMRLLDYGCGGGAFLQHASQRGWEAEGFDVGQRAIEAVASRGLKIHRRLPDARTAGFDVITMNHVLEHIEDMEGVLASLKRLLAPQGLLYIEVPNCRSLRARLSPPLFCRYLSFDERFRAFPIHLYYFTPASLKKLLEKMGYKVLEAGTAGMGIEELLFREEQEQNLTQPSSATATSALAKTKGGPLWFLKQQVKRVFCSLDLGENAYVIVSAR